MRSNLNNPHSASSSMYSRGTNPNLSTVNGPSTTPRSTRLFGRREQTRSHPSPNASTTHLPTHSQPMPMSYSPIPPPTGWDSTESNTVLPPQPAVLPDRRPTNQRSETSRTDTSLESTSSSAFQERQRRKRRRRQHRHHHQRGWVRPHRSGTPPASRRRHFLHDAPKGDNTALAVFVAALFLAATLATYLAIALAVKGLGQELHILFSLTLAGGVIFLGHSLYRFRRARKLRQRREQRRQRQAARHPERTNFTPDVPIRVHMAQDEEIIVGIEEDIISEKVSTAKPPPPAYGLWRSSVKVNPELLFWQRVHLPAKANMQSGGAQPHNNTNQPGIERQVPRPPSYISDDGVSYVVGAQPRSTVYLNVQRPPDQNHPAFHH